MAKARVLTYGLKTRIHLLLADDAQTPLNEVVVEDSFMELVENIWRDADKDIGEGKVLPKGFEDGAQTFLIELPRLFVSLLAPQSLQRVNHTAACAFLKLSMIF